MAESIWNIYIVHIKYEEIMSMASARRKYHLFSYHIYEPGLSSSPLLCVYHHKAFPLHNLSFFYMLKASLSSIFFKFLWFKLLISNLRIRNGIQILFCVNDVIK